MIGFLRFVVACWIFAAARLACDSIRLRRLAYIVCGCKRCERLLAWSRE